MRVILRDAANARFEAGEAATRATAVLHEAVRQALAAGLGPTEITTITGLARSRIYQIKEQR